MRSHSSIRRPYGSFIAAIGFAAALPLAVAGPVPPAQAAGGAQLWVARYAPPVSGQAFAVTVSPDGTRAYAAGSSRESLTRSTFAVRAYDSATGELVWGRRYGGPGNSLDSASDVVASPDGTRVYVTGSSVGIGTGEDYATVAYDSATGAKEWVSRYNGPANGSDHPVAAAAGSGGRIYVTGSSAGSTGNDYATVAYDGATGKKVWVRRHDQSLRSEQAAAIAVGPDGAVYVTGSSSDANGRADYATVAYDGATGIKVWSHRYNGPGNAYDDARAVATSPDGKNVYVTGRSSTNRSEADYVTVAYDSVTGAQVWSSRYDDPVNGTDEATGLGVSPDGSMVYATGTSTGSGTESDYVTVAYDAVTGTQAWASRYNGPANSSDDATAIAVGPNARVYVTGFSQGVGTDSDYATVAYNGVTGAQVWVGRYNWSNASHEQANAIAVSSDGGRAFVAGTSESGANSDWATVAYSTT